MTSYQSATGTAARPRRYLGIDIEGNHMCSSNDNQD